MSTWTVERAATYLKSVEDERRDITKVTDQWPGLDLDTAYDVQDRLIELKVAEGHRIIGVKLGLTSAAKQQRMGIDSPLVAVLTDRMLLADGEPVPMAELIHPRIEPEIVFTMGTDLEGPGITRERAMAAVESVRAGFEVIDSRYQDFIFDLPDVVADNASSARFYLGDVHIAPTEIDLAAEAVDLTIGGEIVDTATGAAVQGHPGEALALAANFLASRGKKIRAGDIVLTGGMTDAVFVRPGEAITATFTHLGAITVTGG